MNCGRAVASRSVRLRNHFHSPSKGGGRRGYPPTVALFLSAFFFRQLTMTARLIEGEAGLQYLAGAVLARADGVLSDRRVGAFGVEFWDWSS